MPSATDLLDIIGEIDASTPLGESRLVRAVCQLASCVRDSDDDGLTTIALYTNSELQSRTGSAVLCAYMQVCRALFHRCGGASTSGSADLATEMATLCLNVSALVTEPGVATAVRHCALRALPIIVACVAGPMLADATPDDADEAGMLDSVRKAASAALTHRDASVVVAGLDCIAIIVLLASPPCPPRLSDALVADLCAAASDTALEMFSSPSAADALLRTLARLSGTSAPARRMAALLNRNGSNATTTTTTTTTTITTTTGVAAGDAITTARGYGYAALLAAHAGSGGGALVRRDAASRAAAVAAAPPAKKKAPARRTTRTSAAAAATNDDDANDGDGDDHPPALVAVMTSPAAARAAILQAVSANADAYTADHRHSDAAAASAAAATALSDLNAASADAAAQDDEQDISAKIDAVIRALKSTSTVDFSIDEWHIQGLQRMQRAAVAALMQAELHHLQAHERRGIARIPIGQLLTSLPSCADTLEVATQLHDNEHLRNASLARLVTEAIASYHGAAAQDQPRCSAIIARLVSKLPFHSVDRVLDAIFDMLRLDVYRERAISTEQCAYRLIIQVLYSLYSQLAVVATVDLDGGDFLGLDGATGRGEAEAEIFESQDGGAAGGATVGSSSGAGGGAAGQSPPFAFDLKNPISWLGATVAPASKYGIAFQEESLKHAGRTALGHCTLRTLHFMFELATDLKLRADDVHNIMAQLLLDLPVIPTSAWLFLHIHLCSGKLASDFNMGANLLCSLGLRILSTLALARPSETARAMSFLLHYTRSADRFPRKVSVHQVVQLMRNEACAALRAGIGTFSLSSASEGCLSATNGSGGGDRTARNAPSIVELSRHISLAAAFASVDHELASAFLHFLLDTFSTMPAWRQPMLHSKEIECLVEELCAAHIDEMLLAVQNFPANSEAFVSSILSIITRKIFALSRTDPANARLCAHILKRHCNLLVEKSADVRFWCAASAFYSKDELRRQILPAAVSCFDSADTVCDAEAGLRNSVMDTRSFMAAAGAGDDGAGAGAGAGAGGGDYVDRGMSPDELLEHLIVMPNRNATFSRDAQKQAIATVVRLATKNPETGTPTPLLTRDAANRVLNKLRSMQPAPPSLLMSTVNLLLEREKTDVQFRRFASVVARDLVMSEVWSKDTELWRGVQVYLELEAVKPNVLSTHILVVVQSLPRRILTELCQPQSNKPGIRAFVKSQAELRDIVEQNN